MPVATRAFSHDHTEVAKALNTLAVPHVNALDAPALARLRDWATVARVAPGPDGTVLGFVLALPAGLPYDSANYRWVAARHRRFLYVDRVVVAPAARGRGVGRALYAAVLRQAREGRDGRVVCEVNERPPNPGSLAFHAALGFREIGRLDHGPDDKAVIFLEHRLEGQV